MASTIRVISGTFGKTEYHVTGNRHPRPLYALDDIPADTREEFDYITGEDALYPRLFKYRGEWYDYYEFERASSDVRALGYDAMQAQSVWDAIVVAYSDSDGYALEDAVIVGHVSW